VTLITLFLPNYFLQIHHTFATKQIPIAEMILKTIMYMKFLKKLFCYAMSS